MLGVYGPLPILKSEELGALCKLQQQHSCTLLTIYDRPIRKKHFYKNAKVAHKTCRNKQNNIGI